MRRIIVSLFFFIAVLPLAAQRKATVDKVKFFEEDNILKATLTANLNKWFGGNTRQGDSTKGSFTFFFSDSNIVKENITVVIRGNFRRKNCFIPPMRLEFKKPNSSLASLGSLKLVSPCKNNEEYDNYLLTEYLIYKMYNLLTDKSFRIRLMELTYEDISNKRRNFTQHAFLIEDTKDMAKRNKMSEWKDYKVMSEQTDREQMTLVAVFEYMIGNTDWSVPATHNIRLIYDKDSTASLPFAVPYDFDYCGMVNAEYAVPYEEFGLDNIKQRLYRGYPRTTEELTKTFDLFRKKKDKLYALVNDMILMNKQKKKEIINYLDEFYEIINEPKQVESIFIRNARKD